MTGPDPAADEMPAGDAAARDVAASDGAAGDVAASDGAASDVAASAVAASDAMARDAAAAARLVAGAAAILVDLDGTLVDSTAPVRRAWGAFADRHGLDVEAVHRFAQGRPSRESIRLLVPDADVDAETAAVEDAEVHDTAGVIALPGAGALLSADRSLAIVTSCSTALAHVRLRAAGLPIRRVLVSSDGLERGKPDPACFRIAARRLGAEPARCVVIEDAPAGICAGRAAGATVIAVRTTHSDGELVDAHTIVDDVAALVLG